MIFLSLNIGNVTLSEINRMVYDTDQSNINGFDMIYVVVIHCSMKTLLYNTLKNLSIINSAKYYTKERKAYVEFGACGKSRKKEATVR